MADERHGGHARRDHATGGRPPRRRRSRPHPSRSRAPAPAPTPAPSLAAGTTFSAAANDSVSSRTTKSGATMQATVGADVKDADGRVVIPAGSTVTIRLDQFKSAPAARAARKPSPPRSCRWISTASPTRSPGRWTTSTYTLKGRGITAGTAAKVGGGAAAGAIARQGHRRERDRRDRRWRGGRRGRRRGGQRNRRPGHHGPAGRQGHDDGDGDVHGKVGGSAGQRGRWAVCIGVGAQRVAPLPRFA